MIGRAGKEYVQRLRGFNGNVRLYLGVSVVLGFGYFGINGILLNLYLLRLSYGLAAIGIINGLGMLTNAGVSLLSGLLAGRWGNRRLMIGGMGLILAGLCLLPLGELLPAQVQTAWITGSYMLASSGVACYVVNNTPFVSASTTPAERGHVFSTAMALFPAASILAGVAAGVLPGLFGRLLNAGTNDPEPYRYAFIAGAALHALALVALLRTQEPAETYVEADPDELGGHSRGYGSNAAPMGLILFVSFVLLLRLGAETAVGTYFNVYLDRQLAMPVSEIGLLMAAGRMLAVPVVLTAPFLMARWGTGHAFAVATLAIAICTLPLALIPLVTVVWLTYPVFSALTSLAAATYTVYSQGIVPPGSRTTMSAVATAVGGLGSAVIALAGGWMAVQHGYPALFLAGAGLTLSGSVVFWAFLRFRGGELPAAEEMRQTTPVTA
jgi:MFS family permease